MDEGGEFPLDDDPAFFFRCFLFFIGTITCSGLEELVGLVLFFFLVSPGAFSAGGGDFALATIIDRAFFALSNPSCRSGSAVLRALPLYNTKESNGRVSQF